MAVLLILRTGMVHGVNIECVRKGAFVFSNILLNEIIAMLVVFSMAEKEISRLSAEHLTL